MQLNLTDGETWHFPRHVKEAAARAKLTDIALRHYVFVKPATAHAQNRDINPLKPRSLA
jgi:hypothetical protein